ncbi:MAG: uroporphyrinogen-III synthase [Acidobacteriota bacterium]|nr:uroporphyrinogen-III synthase [Acidobacteriota bacterium]
MLIVLTREAGMNAQLREWVGDAGDVVEAPLTRTAYREVTEVAREIEASGLAGAFASLVVTSARVEPYVATALAALAEGAEVFSVGPATTQMLQGQGARVAAESTSRAQRLEDDITRGPVLFVGARDPREELPRALADKGLVVVPVVAYETVAVEVDEDVAWLLARADVVVIGAPSAWSVARTYVASSSWVVVPGETTAEAVRHDHARVVVAWGEGLGEVLGTLDAG